MKVKHIALFNGYPACNTHFLKGVIIADNSKQVTCSKCKKIIKNKHKPDNIKKVK